MPHKWPRFFLDADSVQPHKTDHGDTTFEDRTTFKDDDGEPFIVPLLNNRDGTYEIEPGFILRQGNLPASVLERVSKVIQTFSVRGDQTANLPPIGRHIEVSENWNILIGGPKKGRSPREQDVTIESDHPGRIAEARKQLLNGELKKLWHRPEPVLQTKKRPRRIKGRVRKLVTDPVDKDFKLPNSRLVAGSKYRAYSSGATIRQNGSSENMIARVLAPDIESANKLIEDLKAGLLTAIE